MKILRNLEVPTGNILVCKGRLGNLEMLSLADYGKGVNLNQNQAVVDGTPLLPLSEKWVLTLSTQYGCSMGCTFCDVPKVGPGINATYADLAGQLCAGLFLHPRITNTKRLNIHFARMGEPTWNPNVLTMTKYLGKEDRVVMPGSLIHPVISTMLPKKNKQLFPYLVEWMRLKNDDFNGDAGLQFSINSTDDAEREVMFSGNSCSLYTIHEIGVSLPKPKGRKITLNFAVADYTIDAYKLAELFDPRHFICKLTPMHKTHTAMENGIKTEGDYTTHYPYLHHAEALRKVGFDVLTFIASHEEDAGRVTCGNAILSGSVPHKYKEVK